MGGLARLAVGMLVAALSLGGILPTVRRAVAAADDYNIAFQGQTTQQALGISPDGGRVCAVWTRFDVPEPQAFFRLYDVGARGWSPPLNVPPFQVSAVGNVNRPRCAIDAAGHAHVVWQQKHRAGGAATGQLDVAYRRLSVGGNAADAGAWSGIETLAENRSAVDIDAVTNAPNGKVWIVARNFREGGTSELELRAWEPGSGWSGARVVDTGGLADAPRIAVDTQGFVHLVFRNGNGGGGIGYVRLSPDGGFGPRVAVPNGTNAGAVDIAVDRGNGDVHVVYAKDFTKLFYARKSYTGDFSLAQLDEGSGQVDEPGIAWSANGQLTVAYTNGRGGEVALQVSTDGGRGWSGRSTFTSPDGGVAAPWLVADQHGVGYVAYNRRAGGEVFFATTASTGGTAAPPAPTRPPPSAPSPPEVPFGPSPACFAETGRCVRGLFLAHWIGHGALAVNGYPLSEEFPAYLEDGRAYTVQYFERVRLEYHPENAGSGAVLVGQFGRALHPAEPPTGAIPGAAYFPETGHNITRPEFAAYYAANGGLAQFGYPLGEEAEETLEDGRPYRVQYFERARFEWHPESADARYRVQLGQFGRRILARGE